MLKDFDIFLILVKTCADGTHFWYRCEHQPCLQSKTEHFSFSVRNLTENHLKLITDETSQHLSLHIVSITRMPSWSLFFQIDQILIHQKVELLEG